METSEFSRDLTSEAEAGLLETPLGRDNELQFIFRALAENGKSSVMIKGPAGCGKTAIAEGVAYHMVNNPAYRSHPKKRLIALDLTALNAGAMYVGQFEERVTKFLNKVRGDDSLVVFIDEIHMLMGFGKASSSGASRDLSQIIKPALARGEMSCIGATTNEEFDRDIAPDGAFVRRFTELALAPLGPDAVLKILQRMAVKAKYTNGLEISEPTLRAVVVASEAKWPTRFQPDKAIDLMRLLVRTQSGARLHPAAGSSKGKGIDDYIKLVNSELTYLQRQDYEGLKKLSEQWLDVRGSTSQMVNLDEASLTRLLETTA